MLLPTDGDHDLRKCGASFALDHSDHPGLVLLSSRRGFAVRGEWALSSPG
jgi:hypothetical protein